MSQPKYQRAEDVPFAEVFAAGHIPVNHPPGRTDWSYYVEWCRLKGQVDRACEPAATDTRNLDELLSWLEYGRTSGYRAARCSEAQEHHWADLLRALLKQSAAG